MIAPGFFDFLYFYVAVIPNPRAFCGVRDLLFARGLRSSEDVNKSAVRQDSSPMSSFHTAGFARIYSANSETHTGESRSITFTPSERNHSIPP
jgi:hypothetical protein